MMSEGHDSDELVEHLLKCSWARDKDLRDLAVNDLRIALMREPARHNNAKIDLQNIVEFCLDEEMGLYHLLLVALGHASPRSRTYRGLERCAAGLGLYERMHLELSNESICELADALLAAGIAIDHLVAVRDRLANENRRAGMIHRPRTWTPHILLAEICDWPAPGERPPPVQFAQAVAADPRCESAKECIQAWLEKHGFASVQDRLEEDDAEAQSQCENLRVVMIAHPSHIPGAYELWGWWIDDAGHFERIHQYRDGTESPTSMDRAVTALLNPAAQKGDIAAVELIFPMSALCANDEAAWKTRITPKVARLLEERYPVVVRSYERIYDPAWSQAKRLWQERWRQVKDQLNARAQEVVSWSPCDADAFANTCVCVALAGAPTEHQLEAWLATGLPIALWRRAQSDSGSVDGALHSALDGSELSFLPRKLKELRCGGDNAIGRQFKLLWDDADRIPPDAGAVMRAPKRSLKTP